MTAAARACPVGFPRRSPRVETVRLGPVLCFFGLAYALSWAWWVPLVLEGQTVQRGDRWPTQVPGLLGPMLAALLVVAVTERRRGLRGLLSAMVRWPHGLRWQVAAVSPLIFLGLAVPVAAAVGDLRSVSDFGRLGGAAPGVFAVALVLLLNGFGE